ncbi:hypothetical protein NXS19_004268 [Fusarium pseudograminearum]|nr:hypothetical protein FPSE5266_09764 [Fusarium pseudograminearum]UZP36452.1 hypothetical protein NXS19_004268 [Fusarium pseudograminearum]
MTGLCLMGLVSASVRDDTSSYTTETSSMTSRRAGQSGAAAGNVIKSCGSHISVCGAEDEDNVIYIPRSTETETNEIHSISIKRLKPTTLTVTEISVSTIIEETMGHCRRTVTAAGPPAKVTIDVTIVSIQEVQDVDTVVETVTSTTTASVVEQCFLETYTILGREPITSRRARPDLVSTESASPPEYTDAATYSDESYDESTPNNMAGGLDGPGIYEQSSDE